MLVANVWLQNWVQDPIEIVLLAQVPTQIMTNAGLGEFLSSNHVSSNLITAISMSALFNFESLLLVILLLICTCTYLHAQIPAVMDRNKHGYLLQTLGD